MGRIREVILDVWSSVSHKGPMQDDLKTRIEGWSPAAWMGEEHKRRLTAYTIFTAYDNNVSREFLVTTNDVDRNDRREYGDAALVIDTVLAHVLGESQEVVVPGAEDYDPELDEWEPGETAEGEEPETDPRSPEQIAANAAARALAVRQDFLREWADDVHLSLRLTDHERNAVRSGDGVLLLGWNARQGRPVPAVMDPGFYFPVLPDTLDSYDYPEKVHFAWELPGEDFDDGKARIRRITYELRDLVPIEDADAAVAYDVSEEEYDDAVYSLPEGTAWATIDEDGVPVRVVVRQYPWRDEPSRQACFVTDATWKLDDLKDANNVDGFSLEHAEIATDDEGNHLRDHDLGIDFLPVIHQPNTPPGGEHYGTSSLARVSQLLDDIQTADTDAESASSLTGSPIIGYSGGSVEANEMLTGHRSSADPVEVTPGMFLKLGANGKLTTVDTSGNLKATRENVQALLDRLAVNSRLPAAVLGRVKPSEVPSGFAMQLSFGPLSSMIRQMRLVRSVKYPLMLKMVQRLYQANGVLDAGPTPRAEVQLGSFLPSDRAGVLAMVKDAYDAGLVSLETAVAMLLEAGFPIDDVAEEIERIQSRDFEGAGELADATGDTEAAREYLGMEPATVPETTVPPVPIPGAS